MRALGSRHRPARFHRRRHYTQVNKPNPLTPDPVPLFVMGRGPGLLVHEDVFPGNAGGRQSVQMPGQILLRRRYTRIPNIDPCTVPKVAPVTGHCGGSFGTT